MDSRQQGRLAKLKGEITMKYYYNDKLVRTSKTHEYHYALINTETGKCLACGKDIKNPMSELEHQKRWLNKWYEVQNGTYRKRHHDSYTAEEQIANAIKWYSPDGTFEGAIKKEEERIAKLKIVELEARA